MTERDVGALSHRQIQLQHGRVVSLNDIATNGFPQMS